MNKTSLKILIVLMVILSLGFLIFNTSESPKDAENKKLEKLKKELVQVCTAKLENNQTPLTDENIELCVKEQIQSNHELYLGMEAISNMPDTPLKILLMTIVIRCCKENKINGMDDITEQLNCVQSEIGNLQTILKNSSVI